MSGEAPQPGHPADRPLGLRQDVPGRAQRTARPPSRRLLQGGDGPDTAATARRRRRRLGRAAVLGRRSRGRRHRCAVPYGTHRRSGLRHRGQRPGRRVGARPRRRPAVHRGGRLRRRCHRGVPCGGPAGRRAVPARPPHHHLPPPAGTGSARGPQVGPLSHTPGAAAAAQRAVDRRPAHRAGRTRLRQTGGTCPDIGGADGGRGGRGRTFLTGGSGRGRTPGRHGAYEEAGSGRPPGRPNPLPLPRTPPYFPPYPPIRPA